MVVKKIVKPKKEKVMPPVEDKNPPKPKSQQQTAEDEKARSKSDLDRVMRSPGPTSLGSVTHEEATRAEKSLHREETEDADTGVKTIVSSVNADEAKKSLEMQSRLAAPPDVRDHNLTRNGRLNGDKSIRADRSLEEVNNELNLKAGPNPMVNRIGNEATTLENLGTVGAVVGLKEDNKAMVADLKLIREKRTLDDDDRAKLKSIEERLASPA